MNENEEEMLRMIRENDNPGLAVMTAIKVFAAFLEQLEASPGLPAADPPGSA